MARVLNMVSVRSRSRQSDGLQSAGASASYSFLKRLRLSSSPIVEVTIEITSQ